MPTPWKPQASFAGIIIALGNRMSSLAAKRMGKVSVSRVVVLSALERGFLSHGELAALLNQSKPSTSELLAKMRAEGLIQSFGDPTDARKQLWKLNPKGRELLVRSRTQARAHGKRIDEFFEKEGITPLELQRCKEILSLFLLNFYAKDNR